MHIGYNSFSDFFFKSTLNAHKRHSIFRYVKASKRQHLKLLDNMTLSRCPQKIARPFWPSVPVWAWKIEYLVWNLFWLWSSAVFYFLATLLSWQHNAHLHFRNYPCLLHTLKTRIKIPPYFKIGSFSPLCPGTLLQAIKGSTVPCLLCRSLSNAHLLGCIRGWLIVLQGEEAEHLLMDCCS